MKPFVGLISDTHGLLRPQALDALQGASLILHAGDVGDPAILDRLRAIAPVHAVFGNTDRGDLRRSLPATAAVALTPEVSAYVLHILDDLEIDPAAGGFQAVIYGHTHRPAIDRHAGILYINPGSAGPRRFDLPITVARMYLDGGEPEVEIVDLEAAGRL
jgi:uncharacterized protein